VTSVEDDIVLGNAVPFDENLDDIVLEAPIP